MFGELRKCAQKDKGKKKGAKWEDKEGASVRIFRSRRKSEPQTTGITSVHEGRSEGLKAVLMLRHIWRSMRGSPKKLQEREIGGE